MAVQSGKPPKMVYFYKAAEKSCGGKITDFYFIAVSITAPHVSETEDKIARLQ